ncbi:helix-turn-helix domain-containing protein [Desulforamulus ruminis]|uniref:helix-turn-helix domain-containing protein n=1 Tax=Desulforamulus ruminis TaxID=1564 RepID=UPI002FD935DA
MKIQKRGMSPNEIRAELVIRGIQIKDIAKIAGTSSEAVSMAISDKSKYKGHRRIRPIIAAAIDKTVEEIWPS